MNHIDLVVFDLGGTLVEDRGHVPRAFFAALKAHGIQVPDSELLQHRGRSKREAIRLTVHAACGAEASGNEERIDRIYMDFRGELTRQFEENGVIPTPGAEGVFRYLRERSMKIAITTGFDRTVFDLILKGLSWNRGAVDAAICTDDVPQGRPAPYMIFRAMEAASVVDVRRVMKVGDTPVDMLAGKNAGVRTVGVLTGPYNDDSLRGTNPDHIIPSIAEIPDLLEREGYV